jgi:hypothetical protein
MSSKPKKNKDKNSERVKKAEKRIKELEERLEVFFKKCDTDIDFVFYFKD